MLHRGKPIRQESEFYSRQPIGRKGPGIHSFLPKALIPFSFFRLTGKQFRQVPEPAEKGDRLPKGIIQRHPLPRPGILFQKPHPSGHGNFRIHIGDIQVNFPLLLWYFIPFLLQKQASRVFRVLSDLAAFLSEVHFHPFQIKKFRDIRIRPSKRKPLFPQRPGDAGIISDEKLTQLLPVSQIPAAFQRLFFQALPLIPAKGGSVLFRGSFFPE